MVLSTLLLINIRQLFTNCYFSISFSAMTTQLLIPLFSNLSIHIPLYLSPIWPYHDKHRRFITLSYGISRIIAHIYRNNTWLIMFVVYNTISCRCFGQIAFCFFVLFIAVFNANNNSQCLSELPNSTHYEVRSSY